MYKQRSLAAIFLCCAGLAGNGRGQSFKAEIKLAQTVVKNDETFSVNTAVRNAGPTAQSLIVWTCSYPDQWTADNPAVRVNVVPCKQNVPGVIPLKPGEAYKGSVSLHIHLSSDRIAREKVTFRLGYGKRAYFGTQDFAPKIPLFWSNAVTVIVIGESAPTQ